MTSLSGSGAIYRTKRPQERTAADAFAAMLQANPRFVNVRVTESTRAKHPIRRWVVEFDPANGERKAEVIAGQQETRTARAHQQADGYLVVEDGELFRIANLETGDTYTVQFPHGRGRAHCTCPDFEERCKPHPGMECKHPEIIRLHVERGTVQRFVTIPAGTPVPVQSDHAPAKPVAVSQAPDFQRLVKRYLADWPEADEAEAVRWVERKLRTGSPVCA